LAREPVSALGSTVQLKSLAEVSRAAPLRVGVLQKRLAPFRIPVFSRLASLDDIELRVLVGGQSQPPKPGLDVRTLRSLSFRRRGRGALLHPGVVKQIADLDVLVVEGSLRLLTSFALTITRRLHRVPIVWWTSMYEPAQGCVSFPTGVKRIALHLALERADAVLCYSNAAAELVRHRVSEPEGVFVATNVLDTDAIEVARSRWAGAQDELAVFAAQNGLADRPVILFVGRLVAQKRLPDLLRAFAIVRQERSSTRPLLALVGEGAERDRLLRFAEELGIAADVRFFGEISDLEAICPFFLSSRAFVLPGAGGLAIYHALANGLPAIATHADGTELDLIADGRTGFLCEPCDPNEIASRILRVLDWTSDEWRRASEACLSATRTDTHIDRMIGDFKSAILFAARSGAASHREAA
jgi:glycosyltransferase involved in cell wall biosynthesis